MFSRQIARVARTGFNASRTSQSFQPASIARSAAVREGLQWQQGRSAALAGRRWYSDAAEKKDAEEVKPEEKTEAKSETTEVDALKKELEAKNKEVVDLKDKYLRSVADFRNLQERTKRESQAARDFALTSFAKDLVASVDTFEAALAAKSTDAAALHEGIQMTEKVLMNTLKKHGIERFDPAINAEKFDPNMHEATFQAPQQGKEDGTVFHTQRKGFLLNGRVLRAAQVGIVKNS